jgi:cell division topological specificity factor
MSLLSMLFGNKPKTAHLAKERLQLIIAHERDGGGSSANFLPDLQRELIAVISKYVNVNPDDIRVSLEKQDNFEVLEVNIVLPEKN